MFRCLALGFLVTFVIASDGVVSETWANVRGKSYDVSVNQIPVGTFDDTYRFGKNGGFLSDQGGIGSWAELNLIVFSIWTCTFTDGVTHVTLSGIQFGSSLNAVGSNQAGNTYIISGTEVP